VTTRCRGGRRGASPCSGDGEDVHGDEANVGGELQVDGVLPRVGEGWRRLVCGEEEERGRVWVQLLVA
jgi:hypothetical protein